jgi:hypothetical protein
VEVTRNEFRPEKRMVVAVMTEAADVSGDVSGDGVERRLGGRDSG